ncbi:extracellular elastinolytic metalloproteinase [Coprinopsis cinerea AmutBmut pab1-1]|nr:extracellular elastinolytic metalloproteinase [Coprinopsis cinerea AmutBmut pab1-1]
MVVLRKAFASLLATVLLSTQAVHALPKMPAHNKHATHHTRLVGRQQRVQAFSPPSQYQTFGTEGPEIGAFGENWEQTVLSFAANNFGMDPAGMKWTSGFLDGNMGYGWISQTLNGIPIANAVANLAFTGGKVVSFGSNFVDLSNSVVPTPKEGQRIGTFLPAVEEALNANYTLRNAQGEIGEAVLEYYIKPDRSIALTRVGHFRNEETGAYLEAFIDAITGEIVAVNDFVSHSAYNVVPIDEQSVEDKLITLRNTEDLTVSPAGWHSNGEFAFFHDTRGNNVHALLRGVPVASGNQNSSYLDDYEVLAGPNLGTNPRAATVNVFHAFNALHDVTYRYGFNELAFNFQGNNFGKDADFTTKKNAVDNIIANVGTVNARNQAFIAVPPDGISPIVTLGIFTTDDLSAPRKDSAMANDVLIHEFAHGLTNRMTGGGTARCLQTFEAAGLGEGWSDAMANWFAQKSVTTRDFVIGKFLTGTETGLRRFPYSTNPSTNPLTYKDVSVSVDVHAVGEVWANMLHNVYAALVEASGYSLTHFKDATRLSGNVVFMQLLHDAMKLQPCNPTFVQARDAMLQADVDRYGGMHSCVIWRAFASKGLGTGAQTEGYVESFEVPPFCS